MEHRLTRREFVKNLGAGLVSTGLLAGSTSVLGAENKGGIMKDDDLYYYLLTIMVTSTNEEVHRLLGSAVERERNARKIEMLRDAHALAPPGSEVARILANFA